MCEPKANAVIEYMRLPKTCFWTVNPPMETTSAESVPDTAPEPYWMSMVLPDPLAVCNEVELEGVKTGVPRSHAEQAVEATHKSDEPVSRMTLNV